MLGEQSSTARAIDILVSYLTATDRAAADPAGIIVGIGNLVTHWLNSSADASALFYQFQQDPANPSLQAAVHGRLAEMAIRNPDITPLLESEISKISGEPQTTDAMNNQPQQFDMRFHGTMQRSLIQQGNGTIDQSRKKTFKISVPLAGIALLASGALAGGGVAIYNATTSPSTGSTAEYTYYTTPGQPLPSPNADTTGQVDDPCSDNNDFILIDWTTQPSGRLVGSLRLIPPPAATTSNGPCWTPLSEEDAPFSGNQSGNDVQFDLHNGNVAHGTIVDNTLQFQSVSFTDTGSATLQKTTPTGFNTIFSESTGSIQSPEGNQVLDAASMDKTVLNILTEDYKISVQAVNCPSGEPDQVGETFKCTATVGGQQKQVQITVKNTSGQYEVGQPN